MKNFSQYCRDEDPTGRWTIRVNDQGSEKESGHFIGWSMTLWGSANDPERATPYILQNTEDLPFPPPERPQEPLPQTTTETATSTVVASTTKSYTKPTAHLSTAPASEEDVSETTGGDAARPSPTGDESTSGGDDRMDESTRFWIGAAGYVGGMLLIGLDAFIIIRQIRRRRKARYERISGDVENVRMTSIDGARVTSSGRDRHADVV